MAYRTFVVPVYHSTPHEEDLNRFLASHSVLSVERRWLENAANSAWCFCVDYEAGTAGGEFKGPRVADASASPQLRVPERTQTA